DADTLRRLFQHRPFEIDNERRAARRLLDRLDNRARDILIGERRRKVAPDERVASEIKYLLVRITKFSTGRQTLRVQRHNIARGSCAAAAVLRRVAIGDDGGVTLERFG